VNVNRPRLFALILAVACFSIVPSACSSPSGTPGTTNTPTNVNATPTASDGAGIPEEAAYDYVSVDFVNPTTGWIAGADDENNAGAVFRTTDGGATWTKVADFKQDVLKDIDFVSPNEGWVVGDVGIYHSTDAGATWVAETERGSWTVTREVSPMNLKAKAGSAAMTAGEFVTSTFFIDATTGWAVADVPADQRDPSKRKGVVFGTRDGGKTWETLSPAAGLDVALNDIWFVTAKDGWAVGGTVEANQLDVILHTSDGGRTWTRQQGGAPQMTRAVQFVDASRGWVVGMTIDLDSGEMGISKILASTDGGKTWTRQFDSPRSFLDVFFLDPLRGWAVGDRSAIYATTDGGKSWTQQSRIVVGAMSNGPAAPMTMASSGQRRSYQSLFVLDQSHGWVGGDGVILTRK